LQATRSARVSPTPPSIHPGEMPGISSLQEHRLPHIPSPGSSTDSSLHPQQRKMSPLRHIPSASIGKDRLGIRLEMGVGASRRTRIWSGRNAGGTIHRVPHRCRAATATLFRHWDGPHQIMHIADTGELCQATPADPDGTIYPPYEATSTTNVYGDLAVSQGLDPDVADVRERHVPRVVRWRRCGQGTSEWAPRASLTLSSADELTLFLHLYPVDKPSVCTKQAIRFAQCASSQ